MKRHAFNKMVFFRLPLCLPKQFFDAKFSTLFSFDQVSVDFDLFQLGNILAVF